MQNGASEATPDFDFVPEANCHESDVEELNRDNT
jgi:hypothetical protein